MLIGRSVYFLVVNIHIYTSAVIKFHDFHFIFVKSKIQTCLINIYPLQSDLLLTDHGDCSGTAIYMNTSGTLFSDAVQFSCYTLDYLYHFDTFHFGEKKGH
jgi:hypothetical protein